MLSMFRLFTNTTSSNCIECSMLEMSWMLFYCFYVCDLPSFYPSDVTSKRLIVSYSTHCYK